MRPSNNTKEHLLSLLHSPNNAMIAVDLDGTLCEGEFWGEGEPVPKQDMIDLLWTLYKSGAHIVIYTARQPEHYATTHAWLLKNKVPFHGICMTMKPGADLYIDDKAIHPEDIFQ